MTNLTNIHMFLNADYEPCYPFDEGVAFMASFDTTSNIVDTAIIDRDMPYMQISIGMCQAVEVDCDGIVTNEQIIHAVRRIWDASYEHNWMNGEM